MTRREELAEAYGDDLLFMDGGEFDEALLGVAQQAGGTVAVAYSTQRVLDILARDMSAEEAREYFDFNIGCAYVGEKTPIYIE